MDELEKVKRDNFPGALLDGDDGRAGTLELVAGIRKEFLGKPGPRDLGAAASRIDAVPERKPEKIGSKEFRDEFGKYFKKNLYNDKGLSGEFIYIIGLSDKKTGVEIFSKGRKKTINLDELRNLLETYQFFEETERKKAPEKKKEKMGVKDVLDVINTLKKSRLKRLADGEYKKGPGQVKWPINIHSYLGIGEKDKKGDNLITEGINLSQKDWEEIEKFQAQGNEEIKAELAKIAKPKVETVPSGKAKKPIVENDLKKNDTKLNLQIRKIRKRIDEIIQKSKNEKTLKFKDAAAGESETYTYSDGSKKILNVDEEVAHLEGEIKKLEAQKSDFSEKVKKVEELRKLRKDSGFEDKEPEVIPVESPLRLADEPEIMATDPIEYPDAVATPESSVESEASTVPESLNVAEPEAAPQEIIVNTSSEVKPNIEINEQKEQDLERELGELRKEYARINSSCSEELGRVGKIIGIFLKTKPTSLNEVEEALGKYNAKKHELLDFKIEKLKNRNLSPEELRKEMGDLVKYFNVDEWTNLKQDNDYSKLEKWHRIFGESQVDIAKKVVDWYRKLPFKYKMLATGAVIGLGLVGATSGAGLFSGLITAGVAGRKILASVATGVGTSAMIEGFYRKKEEKEISARSGEIMEQYDLAEADKKMESLVQELELEMESFQHKLKTENEKARKRALWGWVSFAGAMGLASVSWFNGGSSEIPENSGYDFGNMSTEKMENILGGAGKVGREMVDRAGVDSVNENVGETIIGEVSDKASVASVIEDVKNIIKEKAFGSIGKILEVKQGSSLEGTLIEHLKSLGMNSTDAGKEAHLMALDYAKEHGIADKGPYSLIHKGAKLIMSADGKSLLGIEGDDKLGWFKLGGGFELEKNISQAGLKDVIESAKKIIEEGVDASDRETIADTINITGENTAAEGIDVFDKETMSEAMDSARKDFAEETASEAFDNATDTVIQETLNNLNQADTNIFNDGILSGVEMQDKVSDAVKMAGSALAGGALTGAYLKRKEIKNAVNKVSEKVKDKMKERRLPDNFDWRGKRTIQFLSGNDKDRWKTISHWTAREVRLRLPEKNYKRILKVIDKYKKIIGDAANPLPGETIIHWVGRIVDESIKKNVKQIKF